ncbi:MAG: hypothetical protein U0746_06380 [Gemmataceae bacterium]
MRRFLLALFAAATAANAFAGVKVDVSPANGRRDILTAEWDNWTVKDGPSATVRFHGLTFTLRPVGSDKLTAALWKGGLDTGATMTTDGVIAPALELVVSGLTPGKHTVVTYHNLFADNAAGPYTVTVDGTPVAQKLKPSRRVARDDDAAFAFVTVEAVAGRDVVIRIESAAGPAVLNGFEIDTPDPARRATKPTPAHADEHVAEEPTLGWVAAKSAVGHHLYFGTDAAAVARATPQSQEYKGRLAAAGYKADGLNVHDTYYWRVDEVYADGVTPGDIWRFRVRRLAFPGAEGYGRFAIGGRGGRVIPVTNLNDSGPGSLRAAVEADGPRTVVFRVGGVIRLKSKLIISHPYITIAGQTAPGDGICLYGWTVGGLSTHDIILRHLRIRIGDEAGVTLDGAGFGNCDHCIMDHCSISWSIDEGFSSRSAKNITLQKSIIAEALNLADHKKYVGTGKGHSFAGSISGDRGSFHHNLLANCAGRNWSLAGGFSQGGKFAGRLDIRNNVVFNWAHRTTDGGVKELNYVGNLYLPGPATKKFTLLEPDAGTPADRQRYHMAGNVLDGHPEFDADNWMGAKADPAMLSEIRSATPFFEPYVTTHSAREAYEIVLADSGATLPKRDALDARYVREVRERKTTFVGSKGKLPGIIDSQKDVGGLPEYTSAPSAVDGDGDGIPDWWEAANGLNPHDPADALKDKFGDGFTNLERYLNGMSPAKRFDARTNVDSLTLEKIAPAARH